jgi:hypothetical protein
MAQIDARLGISQIRRIGGSSTEKGMEQNGTTVSVRISIDLDRLEQEVRGSRHV